MNTIRSELFLALFFAVSAISIKSKIENDKLYMLIGDETFLINLIENSVTQELISILPMKLKLQNENISSKTLSLSIHLDTSNMMISENTKIKANKGDLFLFKGKELILLNEEIDIIDENGDYYIGQFKRNLRHGKGILYQKNGIIIYDGNFSYDKFERV